MNKFLYFFLLIMCVSPRVVNAEQIPMNAPVYSVGAALGLEFTTAGFDPFVLNTYSGTDVPVGNTATLDTVAADVSYSGFTTNAVGNSNARTHTYSVLVPGMAPFCDLNGCFPGTPDTFVNKDFEFRASFDATTLTHLATVAAITSVAQTTAMTDDASNFTASTMSGTWEIVGETEAASGTFTVDSRTYSVAVGPEIQITRSPATGPVVGWQAEFSGLYWSEFQTIATGVTVDGFTFNVATVPEPSGALLLVGLACASLVRRRRNRTVLPC